MPLAGSTKILPVIHLNSGLLLKKNGYVTGSAGTLKCRLHKTPWITGFFSVKYNESKSIEVKHFFLWTLLSFPFNHIQRAFVELP